MFSPFSDQELGLALGASETSRRVQKHLSGLFEELTISKDRFGRFGVEFAGEPSSMTGFTPVSRFTSRLTYVEVDGVLVGRVVFEMPDGETQKPFFSLQIYRDGRLRNGDEGDQYWQLDGYDDSEALERLVKSLVIGQLRVHMAEMAK